MSNVRDSPGDEDVAGRQEILGVPMSGGEAEHQQSGRLGGLQEGEPKEEKSCSCFSCAGYVSLGEKEIIVERLWFERFVKPPGNVDDEDEERGEKRGADEHTTQIGER